MDPLAALDRIAFLLERADEPSYRVRAFRSAAETVGGLSGDELRRRVETGTLQELRGLGKVTATVVAEAYAGDRPEYLRRLEAAGDADGPELDAAATALLAALRGDLHTHSEWSDGGSPVDVMARTARDLGHAYLVVTDHSPRLTVANGLTAKRLRQQLDLVRDLNEELAPFRVLTGIEVDINEDGSLDQDPALLDQLDVVVASVHSKLRMSEADMTRRLVTAIANPRVDVLGHCTGRKIAGPRRRDPSTFEAEIVFEACRRFGVAVEVNCRPDRLDPPEDLLRLALDGGCLFSIDSDAHAPGQLGWQPDGCRRAAACEVPAERIVNTYEPDDLLAWAASGEPPG